nr:MAG TPA: hypothetical protein [Caudoviricetes sp.]
MTCLPISAFNSATICKLSSLQQLLEPEVCEMDQDFIVTGLLSELKAENIRKDVVIRGLIKVICGVVAAVLVVVAGFLLYLNQYDFGSTTTTTATGVYTLVDSQGNVVATDLTADEIEEVIKSYGTNHADSNQIED